MSLFAQASLDLHPLIYAPPSSWDNGSCHNAQHFLLRWGITNFLPGLPRKSIFLISASQEARITGVSHWRLAVSLLIRALMPSGGSYPYDLT
jgi:hypothetical protein